ncbi:putative armadillo-like helical protein [Helianthus annuus]|nr:putative armadillo-like helical protein [Helianthus annuus]
MSIQSESVAEEGEVEEIRFNQLAQNPPAPADELFDISTTVDPSYVISLIRKLLPPTMNNNNNATATSHDKILENNCHIMDGSSSNDHENNATGPSVGIDAWEEHGCILWDLATSRTHAEFMVRVPDYTVTLYDTLVSYLIYLYVVCVQNLVLEVILATLMVSQSPRVTEISLGIIGNLACHELSRKQIANVKGLIEIIVDQLFVDDTPCLCEEFRLLTLCLQGSEGVTWAHALQPENVLSRILWIVENTLNPQLIEKSVGFLLAISETEDDVRALLLPHLVKLGLPNILINLLAFEISKLEGDERLSERYTGFSYLTSILIRCALRRRRNLKYSVLDTILRAIEVLTVIDGCAQELCSSRKLFSLLGTLIKLTDKIEVANSCVTAAVLIANLLSDSEDLIIEINQDLVFLRGLLDIFPFASDDIEARNALWDVISRFLAQFQQGEMNAINLYKYISILASKSDLIEEELLDHQLASSNNDKTTSAIRTAAVSFRTLINKLFSLD